MLIVTGPEDRGKRLDLFLHERLPEFTRSRLQSWIKEGRARVDGKAARPSTTSLDRKPASETALAAPPLAQCASA